MKKEKNKFLRFLKSKKPSKGKLGLMWSTVKDFLVVFSILLGFVGSFAWSLYLGALFFKYWLIQLTPPVLINTTQGAQITMGVYTLGVLVFLVVIFVKLIYNWVSKIVKDYKDFV